MPTASAMSGDGGDVKLKKEIGVVQGASIILGVIIGSGVFVSPVGVLKFSQSTGLSFVMWIVAGLFSTFGAIVYAELGVTIPESGGEYAYVLKEFGPVLAFLCLWITFIIIGAVSCAANALIFAEYLVRPFFDESPVPDKLLYIIAALGLMLIAFINAYSVKAATRMAIIFTICKVSALILIIVIGFYYIAMGQTESFHEPFKNSAYDKPGQLALAFYQGFWAYGGWNYLNFLTDEMKEPAKNLPRAIILSMGVIIAVYLLTNAAYLAVISPEEMLALADGSVAIAVRFAMKTMGQAAFLMPIFVSASVFGSINGEFLSMSRLCMTGAEHKHLPDILGMISYTLVTPIPSIIFLLVLSVGFIFYQDLLSLIELAGFAFVMVSFLAVLSLIHHRYKHPKFNAGFKLPLFFPVAFLVIDVILGVMTVIQQPMESFYSILMFLAGIVFFLLWTNRPAAVERYHIKFTRTMQKLFLTVPQDREDDSNNANVLPMKSEDSSLVQEWEASITPEHSDTKKRIKI